MSVKKATIVYLSLALIAFVVMAYVSFYGPGAFAELNTIYAAIIILVHLSFFMYVSFTKDTAEQTENNYKTSMLPLEDSSSSSRNEESLSTPKGRLPYLDNMKTFLTMLVVLHHGTCSFVGGGWYYMLGNYDFGTLKVLLNSLLAANQSYFMCMFFFVSAYFTPRSLEKKGWRRFLYERYYRLFLPFAFYFLAMGPFLSLFLAKVGAVPTSFVNVTSNKTLYRAWSYVPNDPGPPWFLAWLLLFNVLYVALDENDYIQMSRPLLNSFHTYLTFIGIGLILGVTLLFCPFGNFAMMPLSVGSGWFDFLFFAAGTVAKRNKWLEYRLPDSERRHAYIGGVIFYVVLNLIQLFFTPHEGHTHSNSTNVSFPVFQSTSNISNSSSVNPWTQLAAKAFPTIILSGGLAGMGTLLLSALVLVFFQDFGNFQNSITKFFSRSAYAVYIIHPFVLCPVLYVWIGILRSQYGIQIEFPFTKSSSVVPERSFSSATDVGSDGLVLLGWFFVNVVTQLITWPLASLLTKIPGLNTIL